jgi:hypothetical protein
MREKENFKKMEEGEGEREREGELKIKIKMGEEEGEWKRRRIIIIKRTGKREGQCVRGRRKNFLVALAFVNHSATWNGGRVGGKKNVPCISLWRELKSLFFNFIKETKKGRQKRTKKLHFYGQGWGGRHCGNATSLA